MNVKSLHSLFLKHPSVCTDTRKVKKGDLFFALKGEHFNGNLFAGEALDKGATYAIVDEKNTVESDRFILVEDVLTSLQELASYHRTYLDIKIIALTGSNGKTTTKELIHTVLKTTYRTIATKGNLNNHIGVPLTLLELKENTEIGIIEMGANHPKEIAFLCELAKPNFGYITNFGKAHLEGFGSLEGVIKAKSELYDHIINSEGILFINAKDPNQIKIKDNYDKVILINDPSSETEKIECLRTHPFVEIKLNTEVIKSHLIGAYNYDNLSAAITIGRYFKVSDKTLKKAIESYIPTNNRSQIITKGTHKIILDAYNANPTSMKAALDNFSEGKEANRLAILGDMFELGETARDEHQAIADYAESKGIQTLYLVGENFFDVQSKSQRIHRFRSFDDLKKKLIEAPISNHSILIKGSRGMALERVLDYLN